MQISPLTIYAIQTLEVIRKHGPLSGEEIAKRLDISIAYAKKTTYALRRAGAVINQPGDAKHPGGYVVVGRPSLRQIMEATEGILPDQPGETKEMKAVRRRLRERIAKGLAESVCQATRA